MDDPFFQSLGTNSRSCFTCHQPDQAWTVTPAGVRERFERSARARSLSSVPDDGSTCQDADISTNQQTGRAAFSLLPSKGLIRVGLAVPANAEFAVADVDDPSFCRAPLFGNLDVQATAPVRVGFLEHRDVGWTGDREGAVDSPQRPRDAGEQRHHRPRPGSSADIRAGGGYRSNSSSACSPRGAATTAPAACVRTAPKADRGSSPDAAFCIGVNDPLNILPVIPGRATRRPGA